jgi:hypothetical protein
VLIPDTLYSGAYMKKINLIKATTLKNLRDNVVIVSNKATYKRKFFIATP